MRVVNRSEQAEHQRAVCVTRSAKSMEEKNLQTPETAVEATVKPTVEASRRPLPKLDELIKNGVHFGHQTFRWHPAMRPFIWGSRHGVHLIDVAKTQYQLEQASKFLESMASEGKTILWVGTKKAAQVAIKQAGEKLNNPYITHRWVGGLITNYSQVKKSITKLLHYEDIIAKMDQHHYTKKEIGVMKKVVERLQKTVGGIRNLTWPIGAIVVVDVRKEHVAIKEALAAGVPVVALVDTNCDPSGIAHVIPANDDVPRAVELLISHLVDAVARGAVVAAARPQEERFADGSGIEQLLAQVTDTEEEEGARRRRRAGGGGGAGAAAGAQRRQVQNRRRRPAGPASARPSTRPAVASGEAAAGASHDKPSSEE